MDRKVTEDFFTALEEELSHPPLWMNDIQCDGVEPHDINSPDIMLPLCEKCPVSSQCLSLAQESKNISGIFGGQIFS